ncbi:hypothetical protein J1C76_09860 [Streptococcus sanguinis]|uniref:hypothetical protein n=1 Tax=Streptococcus sanguinis TaxID=1305 RepID=UPI000F65EB21
MNRSLGNLLCVKHSIFSITNIESAFKQKIEKTYKVAQNGLSDELLSVGESSLFQVLFAISEPSAFIF